MVTGQHDPKFIKTISDVVLKEDVDICIGTRYLDKSSSEFQSTFMRRFGKEVISIIMKMLYGVKVTDPTSGFRAVNKKIIEKFEKKYPIEYPEPESTSEMLRQGFKVKEVSVSMNERQGRSYFNQFYEKYSIYDKSTTCNTSSED